MLYQLGGIDYTFVVSFLNSFDAGTATGESSPVTTTADNPYTITESINYQEFPSGFNTQHITGYQSYCYQYFYGGLAAERTPLFSGALLLKAGQVRFCIADLQHGAGSRGAGRTPGRAIGELHACYSSPYKKFPAKKIICHD